MTDEADDLALQTLLAVRAKNAPAISELLVRRCYQVQRKHQFSTDRAQVVSALDKLIDAEVDKSLEQNAGHEL
jgi:hypothetical protein